MQPDKLQSFGEFYSSLSGATHDTPGFAKNALVKSPAAFDAHRKHLLDLYQGVTAKHSFADAAGQIFDCIPVGQQPALRKSGQALAEPPTLPIVSAAPPQAPTVSLLDPSRADRFGNLMNCPPGTVPVRRVTLDEMNRFEDIDHFFRKGPKSALLQRSQLLQPDAPSQAAEHEYAHAYQAIANIGGRSFLNIWDPTVSGDQIFSLSQQWYVATGASGLQTAEAGWQVYPQKYGHSNPVLFTYWTADGYVNTGSYSNDAGSFVQYSSTCPVGLALEQTSISGGAQAEIEVSFILDGGNWWLFVNGADASHAVGYYPATLYAGGPMATGATEIDFGGETVGTGNYPPMGSGRFATEGQGQAAYQRNIEYFPPAGGVQDALLAPSQEWPGSYTIALQHSPEWGEYFYFGGPGSAGQAPQFSKGLMALGGTTGSLLRTAIGKPEAPSSAAQVLSSISAKTQWGWLTIAAVVLLIACGAWIGFSAHARDIHAIHFQWLGAEAVLLGLCLCAGCILNKRWDGVFIDETNRISLSRVQWIAWLVILLGGFFVEAIWNISAGWDGGAKGSFPALQPDLLALLGIVSGSAVVSGAIGDAKKNAPNAPIPPAAPAVGIPTNVGLLDSNVAPSEASWADLYLGDEVANRGVIDVSRLQKLVITVLLIMTYLQLLWNGLGASAQNSGEALHFAEMPKVGDSFVWLLGISHAAYLAYKAAPKTMSPASTPPPLPR